MLKKENWLTLVMGVTIMGLLALGLCRPARPAATPSPVYPPAADGAEYKILDGVTVDLLSGDSVDVRGYSQHTFHLVVSGSTAHFTPQFGMRDGNSVHWSNGNTELLVGGTYGDDFVYNRRADLVRSRLTVTSATVNGWWIGGKK